MNPQKISLSNRSADGYVIPVGSVHLVFVKTEIGMIGCGAFDVAALERFLVPAAKMKPRTGPSITTIGELLSAQVKEVNAPAIDRGIRVGMSGKEALEHL
ncbi:MAG: YunC family protein [Methanocalculus sp.]|uniref:YunC family protein n=1 Tax=Methanocalculus sp. TaxID=2004547 RepID=UPI0027223551|nr:YunC family protein [Methanocalculus sp.]MDO9540350.1 YunC family protein [Methanocalculus sp.]